LHNPGFFAAGHRNLDIAIGEGSLLGDDVNAVFWDCVVDCLWLLNSEYAADSQ
jgi:hypothetical protein